MVQGINIKESQPTHRKNTNRLRNGWTNAHEGSTNFLPEFETHQIKEILICVSIFRMNYH